MEFQFIEISQWGAGILTQNAILIHLKYFKNWIFQLRCSIFCVLMVEILQCLGIKQWDLIKMIPENLHEYKIFFTLNQTIVGLVSGEPSSASQGSSTESPDRSKYMLCGVAVNTGGLWTRTSIMGDGPSVPKSLKGVQVYFPWWVSSTWNLVNYSNVPDIGAVDGAGVAYEPGQRRGTRFACKRLLGRCRGQKGTRLSPSADSSEGDWLGSGSPRTPDDPKED